MTLKSNTFDNGPEGGSLNTDNSNTSGDAFAACTVPLLYSAAAKSHGAKGAVASATAGAAQARGATPASMSMAARGYFRVNPAATADFWLMSIGRGGGGAHVRAAMVYLQGTNKIRVCSTSSAAPGIFTTALALDPTKFYLMELVCIVGTDTTNGTVKFSYRELGAASPIETFTTTTTNTGTTALDGVLFGRLGTGADHMEVDEVAWDDGATDFIGPVAVSGPLTISAQRYLIG